MENSLKKQDILKTALWNLHLKLGAKMVEFAGYEMPIQYKLGIKNEHLHVRRKAGLFDVSHMGQVIIKSKTGDDPAIYLEKLVPSDIQSLKLGKMRYTTLLNDKGGIIDDLIITRIDNDELFAVFNAARKDIDIDYILDKIGSEVELKLIENHALIALQGKLAEDIVKDILKNDVAELAYMSSKYVEYNGEELLVSRSGYTGEDGFEISVPNHLAEKLAEEMLAWRGGEELQAIGLGARDSLRLEAGFCLYGADIDEETTPIEAGLAWIIPQNRREAGGFLGEDIILSQIKNGTKKKRVGLRPEGKAPVRSGTEIFSEEGKKIGVVTSGTYSPCLEAPIAMAYIEKDFTKIDTLLIANLRGRNYPCKVVKMPFIAKS